MGGLVQATCRADDCATAGIASGLYCRVWPHNPDQTHPTPSKTTIGVKGGRKLSRSSLIFTVLS